VGPAGYAALWHVNELMMFNKEYAVAEYAPGLLLFGSNGAVVRDSHSTSAFPKNPSSQFLSSG